MILNKKNKIYVIAEAGVNHNGSIKIALKLVDKAVYAGADAIKFQTFKAKNIASKNSKKAKYQERTTSKSETQFEMLKKLELKKEDYKKLKNYCKLKKIEFITTSFDHESLDFIVNHLKVKKLKIPSGEVTNGPLILSTARSGLEIILSTGMSSLQDIERALSIIAFGYIKKNHKTNKINMKYFNKAYKSQLGKKLLKEKVTILHCTTEYPAPIEDINLNAMLNIYNKFSLRVGYSDHSEGYLVSLAAASIGASIIEKHFTLNKNMKGPDHRASLNPKELEKMIKDIRKIEKIKGKFEKIAYNSEKKNILIARKVLVAKKNIKKGAKFTFENLTAKRAGEGTSPIKYWEFIGKKAKKNYIEDEII